MSDFKQWMRLWPMGVEDTMAVGVQARVHDPLWLLAMQFAFGEFQHDGGATPIDVCVEASFGSPSRMRAEAGVRDPVEIRLRNMPGRTRSVPPDYLGRSLNSECAGCALYSSSGRNPLVMGISMTLVPLQSSAA